MNHDFEGIADAWTIETIDLSTRVSAAIGAPPLDEIAALRNEIRALRQEMEAFHRTLASSDGTRRIAPYAPVESLVRLS
ncbi:hypothetical protein BH11ARM2_BH11ARM2_30730 [soil metagenome]